MRATMDLDSLRKKLMQIDTLATKVDMILSKARPSVELRLTKLPLTDECSRFGGHPFLPSNFDWPSHEQGEYRFLGQINFTEIIAAPSLLPHRGLLSLFYAFDEEREIFWQDDRYVRAYYWEDLTEHVPLMHNPSGLPGQRIALETSLDIPRRQELSPEWQFGWKVYSDIDDAIGRPDAHLLGYPVYNTLGYDPTPSPGWIPLLCVPSFDEFDWCWHDGDQLMVFIQEEKLAARDFSSLKSDAG